ncbi:MAG: RCC1 domain-containing protein, partial [Candidatus Heteroscillospira sp.]
MKKAVTPALLLLFAAALSFCAFAAPEMPETRIGAANNFTFFIVTPDNKLVGWGDNDRGLAGGTSSIPFSERVVLAEDISAVSGGYMHAYALDKNGRLYGWGSSDGGAFCGREPRDYRQHYDRYNKNSIFFVEVMDDVEMISAGTDVNLALKKDGSVWAWGRNNCGQLGHGMRSGNPEEIYPPVKVIDNCKYVAAGDTCFAVTTDGDLYAWGGYSNSEELCLSLYAPNYICSGVNALSAGLLHMENGDVRRFEVNYRRHQS